MDRDQLMNPLDPAHPVQGFPLLCMSVSRFYMMCSDLNKTIAASAQRSSTATPAEWLANNFTDEDRCTDEGLPGDKIALFKRDISFWSQ